MRTLGALCLVFSLIVACESKPAHTYISDFHAEELTAFIPKAKQTPVLAGGNPVV
ncbi:MAG: hypothetical protein JWN48_6129, partial [Myxococcaceae bacterium]|nr:hypothetical protein [Myxococcaceae bacterium]